MAQAGGEQRHADSSSASTSSVPSTTLSFLSRKMDHTSAPPRCFSYKRLQEITDGFSKERILGSGAFGVVYKGVNKDGETIAVKMLREKLSTTEDLLLLTRYTGRSALSMCAKGALTIIFLMNLMGMIGTYATEIIKGICSGLKYLHVELESPMYHLDLKPANVLLDENMSPMITDFGLSRLFGQEQTKITITSMGTLGYSPPEYIDRQVISNKFDIFSLGVIIIKVMAGPEGYSKYGEMSSEEFFNLVHGNWRARLQAPPICEPEPAAYYEQVKTCIEIALRCVEADRHKRPTIRDIVDKINETDTKVRLWSPLQKKNPLASEYSDFVDARGRFSKDSTLVEGAFTAAYNGSFTHRHGKQELAVKIIERTAAEARDFIAELEEISKYRHRNLVKLEGWSCSRNILNLIDFMGLFRKQKVKFSLVYELVPNGNLNYHLHCTTEVLPWEKRYQIVRCIGSALRYLHHECNKINFHGYIKPSNILLDYNFNAKLAGFGLPRTISENNTTLLRRAIGLEGYMDPQCRNGNVEFNRKTDVYSFGIILLEIACTDKSREQVLELYRRSAAGPNVMEDAADRKLGGVFDRTEMERVIVLGLKCSHLDGKRRPCMMDAMKVLERGIELPAFTEIEG